VAERLLDGGDGHLVVDGDAHAMVDHRQGRELLVLGDEEAGGARRPGGEKGEDEANNRTAHGTPRVRGGSMSHQKYKRTRPATGPQMAASLLPGYRPGVRSQESGVSTDWSLTPDSCLLIPVPCPATRA